MPVKLVTVRSYFDPLAASMAETYLKNVGIPAVLADEKVVSNTWHLANAVQGIKLQVPEDDLAKAQYYLTEIDAARSERIAEADPDPPVAPSISMNDRFDDDDEEFDDPDFDPEDDEFDETESDHLLPFSGGYAQTEEDEDLEAPPNRAESNADRAYKGAAFGLIFLPLQFYVTLLLADVLFSREPLRRRYRRRAIIAACVNAVFLLLLTFYLRYS